MTAVPLRDVFQYLCRSALGHEGLTDAHLLCRFVVAGDKIQELIDTNFKFYNQINDDKVFEEFFLGWLFERYSHRDEEAG
jgi:hypothetical protein